MELKQSFSNKELLNFKLFNKEYVIKNNNNHAEIYPADQPHRICIFQTFDEMMKNYTIYNELLKMHIKNIAVL